MKANLLLTLALLSSAAGRSPALCEDQPQKAAKLDVQVRVEMDYLIYLPKDYDLHESWPLLIFLHGSGERGSDLEKVKVHGPPKLIAAGKQLPFVVVSPQCQAEKNWENHQLLALLDDLESHYKIDSDRICVTGLSLGGYGTWRLAAYAPHRLAAIVPICGGGETFMAKRIAPIPTWVFHGAKDEAVPLDLSQKMVDAMEKEGGNPRLTVYPEAGHDSWTETYDNPALYEWLLSQRRKPK